MLVVQGDHLQLLLQGLLGNHGLPSHGTLMGISAGLFLPTTWLSDLGALSYVGALGVVSALGLTGMSHISSSPFTPLLLWTPAKYPLIESLCSFSSVEEYAVLCLPSQLDQ